LFPGGHLWGDNSHGQLALDPAATPFSAAPVRVVDTGDSIALGAFFPPDAQGRAVWELLRIECFGNVTVFFTQNGLSCERNVYVCGENSYGAFGTGSAGDSFAPVWLSEYSQFAPYCFTNDSFWLAAADGSPVIRFTGRNDHGQGGVGNKTDCMTAASVDFGARGEDEITSVSAGDNHCLVMCRKLEQYTDSGGNIYHRYRYRTYGMGSNGDGQISESLPSGDYILPTLVDTSYTEWVFFCRKDTTFTVKPGGGGGISVGFNTPRTSGGSSGGGKKYTVVGDAPIRHIGMNGDGSVTVDTRRHSPTWP
jgi:hypothetical protein